MLTCQTIGLTMAYAFAVCFSFCFWECLWVMQGERVKLCFSICFKCSKSMRTRIWGCSLFIYHVTFVVTRPRPRDGGMLHRTMDLQYSNMPENSGRMVAFSTPLKKWAPHHRTGGHHRWVPISLNVYYLPILHCNKKNLYISNVTWLLWTQLSISLQEFNHKLGCVRRFNNNRN